MIDKIGIFSANTLNKLIADAKYNLQTAIADAICRLMNTKTLQQQVSIVAS